MVEQKKSGNGMAFIVGGLVVAVAVIAYVLFASGDVDTADTDVGATAEDAADAVGDAADDAADTIDDAAEEVEEDTGN